MEMINTKNTEEDIFEIDRAVGISYCMGEEELYKEVLSIFCEQCEEYLSQLDKFFSEEDWEGYAVVTHGLKGNALNIGASNFSKLSLRHEQAGKNGDSDYIKAEYAKYISILKELVKKVNDMK